MAIKYYSLHRLDHRYHNAGMTKNTDSQFEVTLKKTSSGTWNVQGAPRRQLKPWQRLWLVTGIIYLLMLAGTYLLLMPNQEHIERQMVMSVTEEVRRFEGMAFVGESPQKVFDIARRQGYAAWIKQVRARYRIGPEGNAGFDRIERNYKEEVSGLPMKRISGLLLCIVAWLVPMAALYAMGLVVDWIKRGRHGMQE